MAQVVTTPDAARQLTELPRIILQRVTRILEQLQDWPNVSGCKPLSGELAGYYRKRTGDYRLQFFIERRERPEDDGDGATEIEYKVVVTKIGHRDGFYGE